MSITSADLKFFGSLYPLDVPYGGGLMGATVVQDGIANNVFPDLAEADRAGGRVQMRKVYAAVVSTDRAQLSGATVSIKERCSDPAVDNILVSYGDHRTTRIAVEAELGRAGAYRLGVQIATSALLSRPAYNAIQLPAAFAPPAGTLIAVLVPSSGASGSLTVVDGLPVGMTVAAVFTVVSLGTITDGYRSMLLDGIAPVLDQAQIWTVIQNDEVGGARCYGTSNAPGSLSSGATTAVLDRTMARLMPSSSLPVGGIVNGFASPSRFYVNGAQGRVPIFRPGDAVLIEDGSNTEAVGVASVNHSTSTLTFATALVHSYSSGASVRSLCTLGDMQGSVSAPFTQQTWTKTFADGPIGAPISAAYNLSTGAIDSNNLGATSERWAVVFTSATDFKVIGESLGQLGSGNTSTNFSPVNPNTGGVYFTIDADGWGSGWSLGNVMRFNTIAARAPFWLTRTVSPSAPGGPDQCVIQMRGSV